jgi:hypothetical protein
MPVTNAGSGTNVEEIAAGISRNASALIERLAAADPLTLACMHGSAWRGDGAKLLRALAASFSP